MVCSGRRYCQTRLVQPCLGSLNTSDCFILIAPLRLFLYIGEQANIIEKSKANEIYDYIRARKDLGVHRANTQSCILQNVDLSAAVDSANESVAEFLNILKTGGGGDDYYCDQSLNQLAEAAADEDESYETAISETNRVHRLVKRRRKSSESDETEELIENNMDDEILSNENNSDYNMLAFSHYYLEPVQSSHLLTFNMLDENAVLVFDFGAEMYVWSGRNATNLQKKAAMHLAKCEFENGYDYTEFSVTPLKPVVHGPRSVSIDPILVRCEGRRARWTLFARQIQNMETILFREKFVDWPTQRNSPTLKKNTYNPFQKHTVTFEATKTTTTSTYESSSPSALSSRPSSASSSVSSPRIFEFEPLDGEQLRRVINFEEETTEVVNLVLENTNLGRGDHWFDSAERRSFEILTERVRMYRLADNQLIECDVADLGHLSNRFAYLVKWKYKVNAVGFRTLKGNLSQHHLVTGRDR